MENLNEPTQYLRIMRNLFQMTEITGCTPSRRLRTTEVLARGTLLDQTDLAMAARKALWEEANAYDASAACCPGRFSPRTKPNLTGPQGQCTYRSDSMRSILNPTGKSPSPSPPTQVMIATEIPDIKRNRPKLTISRHILELHALPDRLGSAEENTLPKRHILTHRHGITKREPSSTKEGIGTQSTTLKIMSARLGLIAGMASKRLQQSTYRATIITTLRRQP